EWLARPFRDWAAVIQVNLIGLALCTHRILPGMITRGYGRVINLVSRAAEFPLPTMSAYAASKAGILSFTQALAAAVGPPIHPDILINALIPGLTDTAAYREAGFDPAQAQAPKPSIPTRGSSCCCPLVGRMGACSGTAKSTPCMHPRMSGHHARRTSARGSNS